MAELNQLNSPLPPSPPPLPLFSPTPLSPSIPPSSIPPSIPSLPTNLPTNPILPTPHHPPPSLAPKRQRRPSVRLGDIGGDPTFENSSNTHTRRPKPSFRYHKDPSVAIKNSKTRPLTNLLVENNIKDHSFLDRFDFGQPTKVKSNKPIKRARTNWTPFESTPTPSESPKMHQELSPGNYRESLDVDRGSESSGGQHETNGRGEGEGEEFRSGSVKDWLVGLGLGRYAPVFEIHEVDEEVLGMLTMEDLKDMGVNAVGSRRKMYTAIEKLRKEFL